MRARFTTLELRRVKSSKDDLLSSLVLTGALCTVEKFRGYSLSRSLSECPGKLSKILDFLQKASIWVIQVDFCSPREFKE